MQAYQPHLCVSCLYVFAVASVALDLYMCMDVPATTASQCHQCHACCCDGLAESASFHHGCYARCTAPGTHLAVVTEVLCFGMSASLFIAERNGMQEAMV